MLYSWSFSFIEELLTLLCIVGWLFPCGIITFGLILEGFYKKQYKLEFREGIFNGLNTGLENEFNKIDWHEEDKIY